jgi:hypothetical protein
MVKMEWRRRRWGGLVACSGLLLAGVVGQAGLTAPLILGQSQKPEVRTETDRPLLRWAELLSQLRQLDRQTERLEIREIGRSREGRTQVALFVSAPENLRGLGRLGEVQRRLLRPDTSVSVGGAPEDRVVVLFTAGMDPAEVGGTVALTRLLQRLLTERSEAIERILEEVVIIILPSLNPDGTDHIADQLTKSDGSSAGTAIFRGPRDGCEMEFDFDSFTLVETQLLVDKILNQWRPQIWYNLHQTALLPFKYNYLTSSLLARQMLPKGRVGTDGERIGSPASWSRQHATLYVEAQIPLSGQNATSQREGAPTPADALSAKLIEERAVAAASFLEQVAVEREQVLRERQRLVNLSKVMPGAASLPFGYILPEPTVPDSINRAYQQLSDDLRQVTGSDDERHARTEALYNEAVGEPSTSREIRYFYQTEGLDRLLTILRRGGVEVRRADKPFTVSGRTWPTGTHLVKMDQPNARFARDILDPITDRRSAMPGLRAPLPLLLNVETVRVDGPLPVESKPEPMALVLQERVRENGGVRVGVFRDGEESSDEGWIRSIFDQYRFGYVSVNQKEILEPGMLTRYDAIILPDQLVVGGAKGSSFRPAERSVKSTEAAGGLGEAGFRAIRAFVESGGTVISFNRASISVVRQLGLPVREILRPTVGRSGNEMMSILRLEVDPADPLSLGVGRESIACFENGPAFEILDRKVARVVASYPATREIPLRLDGKEGDLSYLRGRAAVVEVRMGRGRVVLFGFRPLYRGRSLATYPFVFNALMTTSR